MEIPCSWPLHIRSSIANELRLTHLTRSRTLLRRPSGGSYAPGHSNYNNNIILVCRKKNVDDSMICVQYSLQHLNMHYTMFMQACMSY